MTFRLSMLEEAKREFKDAISWHARAKKGLGKRFSAAVRQVMKRLRKMPKAHPIVLDDLRQTPVKGFSYVVIYRVVEKEVTVVSVFHTSRDPDDWKSRI